MEHQNYVAPETHFFLQTSSLGDHRHYFPQVWPVAMFHQINPLPCAKLQLAPYYGDRQCRGQQSRLDMCGHVIWPLIGVGKIGHRGISRGWNQAMEKFRQIGLHLWIGILLDQKTGGGVLNDQSHNTRALHPPRDIAGDFIQAWAVGLDGETCVHGAGIIQS